MNGTPTQFEDGNDGDLRDPALRRALAHAPDRDATPDPRTRDAILKMAHNLAGAPVSTAPAANSASTGVLPWWRRLWGGGGAQGSRMPWNAAFATVLVAAFVTVLWRSEPVPQARLDGEARVGGAAAPAAEAPAAPSVANESLKPAPAATAAPEPVPPPAVAKQAPAASSAPSADAAAQAAPARAPAAEQRAQVLRDASSAKETTRAQSSRKEAAPEPVVPAPAPAPAIAAEQSAPAPAQDERREERVERERRSAFAAPAAPVSPTAPAAAATPPPAIAAAPLSRSAPQASALARQDDANAQASGALQDAAPRAAKAAPPQTGALSFSALERWTSFSAGGGARRARGDVEGLPALVGTVARSATAPDAPLDAPVEARLSLYRGDALIAVLEIAGDQVRWTPQPGGSARVGTPPAQALDALRSLLAR
ncbi:hypothetical protein VLK31_19800 [Variovorax sp. H27-G14]|uniref:hypothetical protein n=1 Tax=Variovorax sp. H27-G14 TaxID=3111914 RepID=UPI0038FCE877